MRLRMAAVLAVALALTAFQAPAQDGRPDGIFDDYAELRSFLRQKAAMRDFVPLIQRLGGRDEYSPEQLDAINSQFRSIYPAALTDDMRVRTRALENGFREEIIAFREREHYLWIYLLYHERGQDLVVINFSMNSNAEPILTRF
ncbi:hypothetical protein Ga0609869_002290 [Rhodovulum iodosum]|uniref:DUF3887 domain-containing protein n=1 Tax=Rhodovulum iodosum TaxID=68291 RepID=A0ABV3XX61_9RHOB|nr:hypothetical protein [Rhodovulum robiginosum]RSK34991.1 hypothetical protein EJA01_06220 [Rhodovulum robiginosum]